MTKTDATTGDAVTRKTAGTSPNALDRLAVECGIEIDYENAKGELVAISDATKRAILAAMRVPAEDDAAVLRSLEERARAAAARLAPPVLVIRQGDPVRLALHPQGGEATLLWRIVSETEQTLDGELAFERGSAGSARELVLVENDLPLGYHRLQLETGKRQAEVRLIVAPERCHQAPELADGARLWGLAAQLYTVRTDRDLGIGDFGDLQALLRFGAARGAAVVGLNPLHALFLSRPSHVSPYSPASRLFLSPLYIDPRRLPEFEDAPGASAWLADARLRSRLDALRRAPLVDYPGVAALKLELLDRLWRQFRERGSPERQAAFAAFRAARGRSLERWAIFQALGEMLSGEPGGADWRSWPAAYRDAGGAAVARFAMDEAARVEFFAWLEWVADEQLAAAAEVAQELGMPIGLYRDLAVGADPTGAETWANPAVVVEAASVGAPPDLFNPAGQNWGLPPLDPNALQAEGYVSFTELLRANMRHAGGLRIDHVMALQHLFWIPRGSPASEGAYVAYPFEDLLGILALESHRQSCIVVGEDLGTVPRGFRERLAGAGVLSYKVLFFEWQEDGSFVPPEAYPPLSLSTVGSHDLATLRGWWEGHDNGLKATHGFFPSDEETAAQIARREQDRAQLVAALRRAGLALPPEIDAQSPWSPALGEAVHAYLARTGSAIAMVQLDDLAGNPEQVNLPGSVDEYPNWRRKLAMSLDELAADQGVCALLNILAAARGLPVRGPSATATPAAQNMTP